MNLGPWAVSDMWRVQHLSTVTRWMESVMSEAFDKAYMDMIKHGVGFVKLGNNGDAAYQDEMRRG